MGFGNKGERSKYRLGTYLGTQYIRGLKLLYRYVRHILRPQNQFKFRKLSK